MTTAGRPGRRALGAPVLVAALLAGCGPADTATPGVRSAPSTSGAPAPTPAPPARPSQDAWDASGPSLGVDRADWPGTAQGARELVAALPEELGGEPRDLGDPREHVPGVDYGRLGTVSVQTEEEQEGPDRLTTYQLLMAGFGLGALCAEGTYRGTAGVPVLRGEEQEAALADAAPGVQDGSAQAWFSCRPITEDDEWGHAVGWTSGTTAWQLYARDEQAARLLVTALHEAAP